MIRRLKVHDPTPRTLSVARDGGESLRTTRNKVLRLTVRPTCWLRRVPAAPPSASPMALTHAASRGVRRAQGATTPGRRAVKIRRGHWR
jgi:hypothetical protein